MDENLNEALHGLMKIQYTKPGEVKEEEVEKPDIRKSTALLRIISASKKDTK